MHELVKVDGSALEYAGDTIKSDKEIVLSAVKSDPNSLRYSNDKLSSSAEFIKFRDECVEENQNENKILTDTDLKIPKDKLVIRLNEYNENQNRVFSKIQTDHSHIDTLSEDWKRNLSNLLCHKNLEIAIKDVDLVLLPKILI